MWHLVGAEHLNLPNISFRNGSLWALTRIDVDPHRVAKDMNGDELIESPVSFADSQPSPPCSAISSTKTAREAHRPIMRKALLVNTSSLLVRTDLAHPGFDSNNFRVARQC